MNFEFIIAGVDESSREVIEGVITDLEYPCPISIKIAPDVEVLREMMAASQCYGLVVINALDLPEGSYLPEWSSSDAEHTSVIALLEPTATEQTRDSVGKQGAELFLKRPADAKQLRYFLPRVTGYIVR